MLRGGMGVVGRQGKTNLGGLVGACLATEIARRCSSSYTGLLSYPRPGVWDPQSMW